MVGKRIFLVFNHQNKKIYLCRLALNSKIWFLETYRKKKKNKTLLRECKCIHCKQKLAQINNSIAYWDKLSLSKNLT